MILIHKGREMAAASWAVICRHHQSFARAGKKSLAGASGGVGRHHHLTQLLYLCVCVCVRVSRVQSVVPKRRSENVYRAAAARLAMSHTVLSSCPYSRRI